MHNDHCLDEIEDIASVAENHVTKEPLYYDIINRTEALREIITPWYVRLWRKWIGSRPLKDSEIPF
jgi:hypothetical protein